MIPDAQLAGARRSWLSRNRRAHGHGGASRPRHAADRPCGRPRRDRRASPGWRAMARRRSSRSLCGLRRPAAGDVTRAGDAGRRVAVTSLAQAARHGIAYLPRDRRATGIFPGQSVFDNFAIAALPRLATAGHRPAHARCGSVSTGFRERLSMVYGAALRLPIGTLSGGNQQKVLLARWLALRAAHAAAQRSDPRCRSRHPPQTLRGVSRPRPRRGHAAGASCRARSRRCCSSAIACWCSASRRVARR